MSTRSDTGASYAPGLSDGPGATVIHLLDEAPTGRFHRRAVLVSGMGFFTDAYDLFVISTVAVLVAAQWHLSTTATSWVSGSAILGAFVGAIVFGRLADRIGRRTVYALVAMVMIGGSLLSALAPTPAWLVAGRLVLGLGVGGDYPVSAVLTSEYANRRDRGRLVAMVFSMQAAGLVVGPLVAMGLLGSGLGHELVWRLLLGLGAVPAASVLWLRTRMPESPRFQLSVAGRPQEAVASVTRLVGRPAEGATPGTPPAAAPTPAPAAAPAAAPTPIRPAPVASAAGEPAGAATVPTPGHARPSPSRLRDLVADRRLLALALGTAGAWFVFDYAYYGNTLSLPAILQHVDPSATLVVKLALSLALFVVFAVPGYLLAVARMDRVGHRRLQWVGFAVMAAAFLALGAIPPLTTLTAPFIAVFGISYFFVEFGPNTTTFVLPSEVFPTRLRTTGHGAAAGLGKLGAFIGVFLVPRLQSSIGLRGMLVVAAGASIAGMALTRLIPEPGGRSLEEVSGDRPAAPPGSSSTESPTDEVPAGGARAAGAEGPRSARA